VGGKEKETEARFALVHPILAYDKYVITKKSSKKDKESSRLTIGGLEVAIEGNETTPGAMTSKQVLEEIRRDLDAFPNAWRSVRVCVILRCIRDEVARNATVKILIFDRSPRTLEVIRFALEKNHYKCLQFDGDTKPADRAKRIGQFCDRNETISVLLLSTGVAALGLDTLKVASFVYIVTPDYNPFVELQALSRAARQGNPNQVTVLKFFTHESYEQRIRLLQEQKLGKAVGLFMQDVPDWWKKELRVWSNSREIFNNVVSNTRSLLAT
jgi:SNF2 family DNA or RNA helicase